MNYGELRTAFNELLNRNDCSDELADRFIGQGMRRVERLLRTPMQRHTWEVAANEGETITELPMPNDYLAMHIIEIDDKPVQRITQWQRDDFSGWYIEDGFLKFNFEISEDDGVVRIIYYNEFNWPPIADGDITTFSMIIGDVVIYAAMVYACTYFTDMRKADFAADLAEMVREVQTMADLDEMNGGGMQVTPYGGGIA